MGTDPRRSRRVERAEYRREGACELLEAVRLHRVGGHPHSVVVRDHSGEISVLEDTNGEQVVSELTVRVQRLCVEPVALVFGKSEKISSSAQVATEVELLDVVLVKYVRLRSSSPVAVRAALSSSSVWLLVDCDMLPYRGVSYMSVWVVSISLRSPMRLPNCLGHDPVLSSDEWKGERLRMRPVSLR